MNLFNLGHFTLHSGSPSRFKIDADALTDEDLEALAYLASERVGPFGAVEGVPTGGERFAREMRRYVTGGPLLIVDDVLSTGASMEEHRGHRHALGLVIFARVPPEQSWIDALFIMQLLGKKP